MAKIYEQFRPFSMIPKPKYLNTLRLGLSVSRVEGCVVECGVWKGGMAAGLAAVMGRKRQYFLFDSFKGLPPAREIDGTAAIEWQNKKDGPAYFDNCTARSDYAYTAMKLSGAVKYKITEGWFDATIPPFVPPEPIAFLHLDADWYESTITCLDGLFRHVAGGGLIVLDDYHVWDGCSRAVHDFLSKHSAPERIRSLGNLCYIEKK